MITYLDIKFMREAELMAQQSEDKTNYKNVGCVIVKDGKVIGRGYRKTVVFHNIPYIDITFHAEHLALMEAGENADGATAYVTMQPCSIRKRGPWNGYNNPKPCCELLTDAKVKRVVYRDSDERCHSNAYFENYNIEVEKI